MRPKNSDDGQPAIEHATAQIAGFGVRMMFVVQHLGQYKDTYKENYEFALANSTTKIFFGNDGETAEYISKQLGDVESVRQTHSQSASQGSSSSTAFGETMSHSTNLTTGQNAGWSSGDKGGNFSGGASSSQAFGHNSSYAMTNTRANNASQTAGANETLHKRPLLTPTEVSQYFSSNADPMALVLLSGQNPMAVRRVAYYDDELFAKTFDPHPDHPLPLSGPQLIARDAMKKRLQQKKEEARLQAEERAKADALRKSNERFWQERRDKQRRKDQERLAQQRAEARAFDEKVRQFITNCATVIVVISIIALLLTNLHAKPQPPSVPTFKIVSNFIAS